MPEIRLLLIDANLQFGQLFERHLSLRPEFKISMITDNLQAIMELLEKNQFEILVLSLFTPNFNGLQLLAWLKSSELPIKPKIIAYAETIDEQHYQQLLELKLDYFMLKPFTINILTQRIIEIVQENMTKKIISERIFEILINMVETLFRQMKIPNHCKGYYYLKDAIIFTIQEPQLVNCITKKLYPLIGQRYAANVSQIERSIRFLIETVWNKGDIELLNNLFGYCIDNQKGKPTNSSFIAKIADQIRLELQKTF